jgi:hypothetical protein
MLSYSGGTAPVFHRLPCYALAGTRSVPIRLSEAHGVYTRAHEPVNRQLTLVAASGGRAGGFPRLAVDN